MKLSLGFSPCPNDTFIFDALVNGKIDTEGLEFDVYLEDVQTLNEWAQHGRLDYTKVSYAVLPLVLTQYQVLQSGGALGKGVGPLLIAARPSLQPEILQQRVAIPGMNTTANLLFSLAYPQAQQKLFMRFTEIEQAVLTGEVDYGVIIHENRFTYQEKGLHKILDLGDYWEKETGAAIPLGGILASRRQPAQLSRQIDRLIRASIAFAFAHYPEVTDYVRAHAQEMSEAVMRQHINLYVNDYSLDLGATGQKAVGKLMDVYRYLHPGFIFPSRYFID